MLIVVLKFDVCCCVFLLSLSSLSVHRYSWFVVYCLFVVRPLCVVVCGCWLLFVVIRCCSLLLVVVCCCSSLFVVVCCCVVLFVVACC